MPVQSDPLWNVRVASPCHKNWESMLGDNRTRYCDSCDLNVYNFSEMTAEDVRTLLTTSEGRVCGRLYRRVDGTIITRDCPVGLRAIRRRVGRIAGAVLATVLSVCSMVFAQSRRGETNKSEQSSAIKIERQKSNNNQRGKFTGVVTDALGAVIPGAIVSLQKADTASVKTTETDNGGVFTFDAIIDGHYTLKVSSPGFTDFSVKDIELKSDELTQMQIELVVNGLTMGVIVTVDDIRSPGKP